MHSRHASDTSPVANVADATEAPNKAIVNNTDHMLESPEESLLIDLPSSLLKRIYSRYRLLPDIYIPFYCFFTARNVPRPKQKYRSGFVSYHRQKRFCPNSFSIKTSQNAKLHVWYLRDNNKVKTTKLFH